MKNLEEEVHLEFSNKNNLAGRISGSESSESFLNDEYSVFSLPPKHFCRTCNIEQEYRTRHCHKCQKCVYKYDHHCFWIGFSEFSFFFNRVLGGCVGELNHRKFFFFLFFQSVVHIWSFFMVHNFWIFDNSSRFIKVSIIMILTKMMMILIWLEIIIRSTFLSILF